jgi:hypothetical protein
LEAAEVASADGTLVEARFGSVIEVARQYRTSVPLQGLSELLPISAPSGEGEVAEWLDRHPRMGAVVGSHAVSHAGVGSSDGEERRARGLRYLRLAENAVSGPLAPISGMVRCIAVTGSAAYGEPSRGDDLDFLVIARRGAVWPTLLYTYLANRLHRSGPTTEATPHWCFNYVLDERAARAEFARPRGFLFAREALTAHPIVGEPYYRGLLGSAGWLSAELPRLYRRWSQSGVPPLPEDDAAPLGIRALNAVLFPLVATYLSLVALVRNHRFASTGRGARRFRVVARLDRMTYETHRFEELRSLFSPATSVPPVEAP